MARRPNTRPTKIYWLVDARTGIPFYCGKTVHEVDDRLSDHRYTATVYPRRPISIAVLDRGENIRIDVVEIVPVGSDWAKRERFWISTLRLINPNCVNVSDGGDGVPGLIHSPETRARLRAAQLGRKMAPDHGAKIAAKCRGQKRSAETLARMSAAQKGKIISDEQRAKIRVKLTGRKMPEGHGERMRLVNTGRKHSEEAKERIRAARLGKPLSAEHRLKLRLAKLGRKRTFSVDKFQ